MVATGRSEAPSGKPVGGSNIANGAVRPDLIVVVTEAADAAYQNAKRTSEKRNARIEHDKVLSRVMRAVLKDDTELFEPFYG